MAQEIKLLGLKLTIVEPGGFRTDWAGASMAYASPLEAYAPSMNAIRGKAGISIQSRLASCDESPYQPRPRQLRWTQRFH